MSVKYTFYLSVTLKYIQLPSMQFSLCLFLIFHWSTGKNKYKIDEREKERGEGERKGDGWMGTVQTLPSSLENDFVPLA